MAADVNLTSELLQMLKTQYAGISRGISNLETLNREGNKMLLQLVTIQQEEHDLRKAQIAADATTAEASAVSRSNMIALFLSRPVLIAIGSGISAILTAVGGWFGFHRSAGH